VGLVQTSCLKFFAQVNRDSPSVTRGFVIAFSRNGLRQDFALGGGIWA
jgi:hypothetical protein